MRTLHYHVATTVDGFIATIDHQFDFFAREGEHVDDYLATLRSYGTVIMGRRTYEVGLRLGVADPYPWAETWVFSKSLATSPTPRVKVVASDVTSTVRALKSQEGGPIYLCGGGMLAARLFADGLIDEVDLKVNPHLLGAGIPLAPVGGRVDLSLKAAQVYRTGVVLLRYEVIQASPRPQPHAE